MTGSKIAIVLSGPFTANGVCRVAGAWARILARAGHEPTLVFETGGDAFEAPGCSAHRYPDASSQGPLTRTSARRRNAVRALQELEARGPLDLAISHDSRITTSLRKAFPRLPLLHTFHSPIVDENRLNNWKYADRAWRRLAYPATFADSWWTDRAVLHAIDCGHTLSRFTRSRLEQRYPAACRQVRWEQIPGTFDDERFRLPGDRRAVRERLGIGAEETVLLTVRRLVPRTGVDRILTCARQAPAGERPVRFLIGGTGPLEGELRRAIAEQEIGGRVELLGFVPDEDLPSYYQAADALLLPTRDLECFGLPVVEGMACGCTPLLVPDGGPPELAPGPECVAGANSTAAFATLVARFVRGEIPARPEALATAARERFSEEAVAPAIVALVHELARGRR